MKKRTLIGASATFLIVIALLMSGCGQGSSASAAGKLFIPKDAAVVFGFDIQGFLDSEIVNNALSQLNQKDDKNIREQMDQQLMGEIGLTSKNLGMVYGYMSSLNLSGNEAPQVGLQIRLEGLSSDEAEKLFLDSEKQAQTKQYKEEDYFVSVAVEGSPAFVAFIGANMLLGTTEDTLKEMIDVEKGAPSLDKGGELYDNFKKFAGSTFHVALNFSDELKATPQFSAINAQFKDVTGADLAVKLGDSLDLKFFIDVGNSEDAVKLKSLVDIGISGLAQEMAGESGGASGFIDPKTVKSILDKIEIKTAKTEVQITLNLNKEEIQNVLQFLVLLIGMAFG